MTHGFFFCTFLSSADSLCIVSGSLGFSKSTELNGRNPSIVIAAGEMADLPHESYGWGTFGDQEHSKSEALEEGDITSHLVQSFPLRLSFSAQMLLFADGREIILDLGL